MLNVVYLTCFIQASFTYRHLCYMAQYNCKQNQDEVEHIHSCKFFSKKQGNTYNFSQY